MPILNFQKQFAPQIESGEKVQTIRGQRKRPIRPGQILYLYTGLRTKGVQKLGEGQCTATMPVVLTEAGDLWVNGIPALEAEKERFAIADGFKAPDAFGKMMIFFSKKHGLPFYGTLIKWRLH